MTRRRIGAHNSAEGTTFTVWAPLADRLSLLLMDGDGQRAVHEMQRDDLGYHSVTIAEAGPGDRYLFRFDDGRELPDPASRFQPDGVHESSSVVPRTFDWSDDDWRGLPIDRYVIYELHVGTFTSEGTFSGVAKELTRLKDLGITAIEIMPVAQFPGERNWGYDGVYPFAAQSSYGGPEELKRLVDEAHRAGLAVILDVVYNHLGPEGNYLSNFAPYFTDKYKTPWGLAINFDDADSDEVRNYFVENALQWLDEFHFDALRLDAVHAIIDHSAQPFLLELAREVGALSQSTGWKRHLIAESDLNDPRVVLPEDRGGVGMDAQWADDFHHALHVLLTGEQSGYYADFHSTEDLATIYERGWLYSGQYSKHRRRRYGAPTTGLKRHQFIVCAQNHDQVGNRMHGDRHTELLAESQVRLALGAVILSPFTPMLFMGEEYGEKAPFQYFTSHTDEALVEAVRKGRREEFAAFEWQGEAPDPHAVETFHRSRITQEREAKENCHAAFVRELLRLRREVAVFRRLDEGEVEAESFGENAVLLVRRKVDDDEAVVFLNFSDADQQLTLAGESGSWRLLVTSDDAAFGGRGTGSLISAEGHLTVMLPSHSMAAYERQ